MARRPLLDTVQASIDVPRGEAGFWSIILDLNQLGTWTVRQVSSRTNVDVSMVARYVRKLRLGGFAVEVGAEVNGRNGGNLPGAKVYRLARKPQLAPRLAPDGKELPETVNEQLWRAMKMSKTFGAADLVELCPGASQGAARNYCYQLAAAGILSQTGHVFRLIRNIGNQAPRILATKMVFDPNAGVIVGRSVAREVQS